MTLSYGSQFGYYGLRLNPTLEQVIGSVRKPLRIPLPDRRAKWYALSPYRALILDAEREANDYETAALDYRNSGAHLPEAAAAIRPSDAGEDHSFRRIDENHRAIDLQSAYETAYQTMDQERKGRTQQQHKEVLQAQHGPNRMRRRGSFGRFPGLFVAAGLDQCGGPQAACQGLSHQRKHLDTHDHSNCSHEAGWR